MHVKVSSLSAAIALAAAACQTQQNQPQPDVWSANYNVPFDVMVACLAAPPTGAFQVYAPAYPEAGMARIVFIPANTPQAQVEYVVLQMVGNNSMVSWKRFGNIAGGSRLARRRSPQARRRLRGRGPGASLLLDRGPQPRPAHAHERAGGSRSGMTKARSTPPGRPPAASAGRAAAPCRAAAGAPAAW